MSPVPRGGLLPLTGNLDWNVFYTTNSVTLQVVAGLIGDFNGDGKVDAGDYIVWRKTDGTQEGYNAWRAHFGETASSGASSKSSNAPVPEPATLALLLFAAMTRYLGDAALHVSLKNPVVYDARQQSTRLETGGR